MATERTILITGASSGIGAATARRLAAPGLRLMLHARGGVDGSKRPALEAVAEEARAAGAEADSVLADLGVGDAGDLVGRTVARFGRLDGIVSNAGYARSTPVGELDRAELDRAFALMAGVLHDLATAALPHLRASPAGRIVAVSSFVAHRMPGGRLFPATAAAKGAVEAYARQLARQLAPDGVTVNCVSPGFTRKDSAGHSALGAEAWRQAAEMTPNGRLAEPADVAAAIAFFLSDEARHITGQVLHVDGGLSLN